MNFKEEFSRSRMSFEQEREQRIQLDRLAAMGEMAMEEAHEIRNLLGSIKVYASMMEGTPSRLC